MRATLTVLLPVLGPPDELLDQLGPGAGRLDHHRGCDQSRHGVVVSRDQRVRL